VAKFENVLLKYRTHPEFLGIELTRADQRSALDDTPLHIAARKGELEDTVVLHGAGVNAWVTLAGIELAHRIRKGQHALPLKREGRKPSLKTMCDCALNRASEPILADSIFCPPISGSGALRENAYLGAVIPNGTALN